jgi:hypothetical protein
MKAVLKNLVAGPLRYVVRLILQRPWLKKRVRDMVTRMPGVHSFVLRVMFQSPVMGKPKLSGDQKNLSPDAQRVHRALKQAIRMHRRSGRSALPERIKKRHIDAPASELRYNKPCH